MPSSKDFFSVRPDTLSNKERYQLLTSVVVPRPIGWISTRSLDGVLNLAPYSFFVALAASPLLVGVSIGSRQGKPKDTLKNTRETGSFCVNICSEDLLEAMNLTSGEYPESVDEFILAGLTPLEGEVGVAPFVGEAPAILECELFKEVGLAPASNVLIIGEVKVVHLSTSLETFPETWAVNPESLRPVGRLGMDRYFLPREVKEVIRPK